MSGERIDLPEPGKTLFSKVRVVLDEFFGGEWTLKGGTLIAGRWGGHRASTDVDVQCAPGRWNRGRDRWRPELERRLRQLGGEVDGPRLAGFAVYGFGGLGRLEITGRASRLPFLGRERALIDGSPVAVEHTAQVLAGKILSRGGLGIARDLFDFAAAARYDPPALECALAAVEKGRLEENVESWLERRDDIAREAMEGIFGVKPEWIHAKADPAAAGARAVIACVLRGARVERGAGGWKVSSRSIAAGDREWGPFTDPAEAARRLTLCGAIRHEDEEEEASRIVRGAEEEYTTPGSTVTMSPAPVLEVNARGEVKARDLDREHGTFASPAEAVRWAASVGWIRSGDMGVWERTLERERARALEAEKTRTR